MHTNEISPTLPPLDVDMRPFRERLRELDIGPGTDFDQANERLYAAGLTDGLPVVPPERRRIGAMLSVSKLDPYETLDPLTPSYVAPTRWEVAANAVMAGCEPRYLPLVIAALRAVADPAFNLVGVQTTTGATAPIFIVHGPVVDELEINAGTNCMGQGRRSNATIGRAIRLVLQNVGLAIPGKGDMATHGIPGKYTWLIAENETDNVWPAFHVSRGLAPGTSAITALAAVGSTEVVLGDGTPEEIVQRLGRHMTPIGTEALLLLPPDNTLLLQRGGWDRARLQSEVLREALEAHPWANSERHFRTPDDVLAVVTGGAGIKATYVPAWGGGTRAVTRAL